ncbi:HipA family kinase [Staphylococcus aureus]|nr:phosphatidylinositol kinase [Staphylococcus aureus]HCW7787175.1 phosphatidylinositol kinase [Staphylococcus aureus]HCW9541105.1 phosphatidylinositol kinase [Staphylococcus aureus]HDA2563484.1 phosphatidylinositol kinase [Staphylococcus aureus]HEK5811103.1 phosphatidylinositol kinase [Staphylococcus aureus]
MVKILTEITSRVGNGVTTPYYAMIDSLAVVVKSINNNEGVYALFNEAVGYCIAERLDFSHPDFGFAQYKSDLTINRIPNDSSFNDKEIFTYTVLENSVIHIEGPGMINTIDNKDIIELIIFDSFISNTDRNKGNILIKMPKKGQKAKLFPLDYTHIFPGECIWFDVLKRGNPSIEKMVEDVFQTGNYQLLLENKSFDPIEIRKISYEIKKKLVNIDMDDIISSMPNEISLGHSKQDIYLLKKFIERNISEFDDIIEEITKHLVR